MLISGIQTRWQHSNHQLSWFYLMIWSVILLNFRDRCYARYMCFSLQYLDEIPVSFRMNQPFLTVQAIFGIFWRIILPKLEGSYCNYAHHFRGWCHNDFIVPSFICQIEILKSYSNSPLCL